MACRPTPDDGPTGVTMSFSISRGRTLDITGFGLEADDLPAWDGGSLDPRTLFADPARPFELEVGSGKGTFLVQQASIQAGTNFLGIEWTREFFRYAADRVRRNGLTNIRMLRDDAGEFVCHRCQPSVVDVIHLYFTDPWPKKRHHKRRVVQDSTMMAMHRILKPSGRVHLVTDHSDLFAWYETHVERHASLYSRSEFLPPGSAGDGEVVGTNFERKYQREGRPFHAMTLTRIDKDDETNAS